MTDKPITTFETTINWIHVDNYLPPQYKDVLIAYVFNYGDDEELDLYEFSRGSIGASNDDDELTFKLKENIWRIHGWSHNQIDKKCLKKYVVRYWAYLPTFD